MSNLGENINTNLLMLSNTFFDIAGQLFNVTLHAKSCFYKVFRKSLQGCDTNIKRAHSSKSSFSGVFWMNWTVLGSVIATFLILLVFREHSKRLELDKMNART